jgi:hypothetical protein
MEWISYSKNKEIVVYSDKSELVKLAKYYITLRRKRSFYQEGKKGMERVYI